MKTFALLLVLTAACGSASPTPAPDGGGGSPAGTGGSGGVGGITYPICPQHRVDAPECMSTTGGVLRKDGFLCASCSGVDSSGDPTAKPLGCTNLAGGG